MTGRSPARLLAPVALVAAAVALFVVVSSGTGDDAAGEATATPTPAATATARPGRKNNGEAEPSGKTYTVQPGDTPLGIAEETGVDYAELLEVNPDIDANALTVGQELELP